MGSEACIGSLKPVVVVSSGVQLILWPFLQVFQTASEKIETECLAALRALSACLSRSVLSSDSEDLLDSFLSSILQGS